MLSTATTRARFWQGTDKYLKPCLFILLGLLVLQTLPLTAFGPGGANNIHVYQALAFLQGHVYLPFSEPGINFDIALHNGHYQCPFPPFPAIVLLPFVALFGESTRVVPISLALTALNIIVLTHLLQKLSVESRFIPWLLAAFFLGSPYWGLVRGSATGSYFANIVAATSLFLALNEAFGKARGVLVGLFLGMAFLSRQLSLYTAIFLSAILWEHPRFNTTKERLGGLLAFGTAFGLAVGVYLTFNWLRFDHPLDTGYSKWILTDPFMAERWKQFGSFHPVYFFHNFVYMFIQGFHLEFSSPMYLNKPQVDPFGTSLTFASPFVFFAFRARWKKILLWGAWLSVGLCLLHMLFYFSNGWVQENGQRYSMDFFPVLMLLVAQGIKNVDSTIWKVAIVYSVGLNLLSFSLISYGYDFYYKMLLWGKATLMWARGG